MRAAGALWDEMEQCFASPEIAASVMHQSGRLTPFQQRVRDRQEESVIKRATRARHARWWGRSSHRSAVDRVSGEFSVIVQGMDMETELSDHEQGTG